MSDLTVEILATGDELLTGQLVDTNSVWLMDRLWDLGLMAHRKTLVGDDRAELAAAIGETTARADVVVMSGGMGPTEDDLTSETVAVLLGVPLELHAPSLAAIEERFQRFGRTMTPNNEKQARFPRGAEVIPNRHGTAPGFAIRVNRAELVCLPGVPSELQGLSEEWLLPRIAARLVQVPASGMVKLFGVPESNADHLMRPIMDDPANAGRPLRLPRPLAGGSRKVDGARARTPPPGPSGSGRGCARLFGDQVFGEGKDELPELVVARLAGRGERVALAESCTGGLVAQLLTEVPGASAVLDLGVVAYANAIKERVLGVDGRAARGPRRGLRAGCARHGRGRPAARVGDLGHRHHRHRRTDRRDAREAGGHRPPGAGRARRHRGGAAALPRRPGPHPPAGGLRGAEPAAARPSVVMRRLDRSPSDRLRANGLSRLRHPLAADRTAPRSRPIATWRRRWTAGAPAPQRPRPGARPAGGAGSGP